MFYSISRKNVHHHTHFFNTLPFIFLFIGWLNGQAPAYNSFNCNLTYLPLAGSSVSALTSGSVLTLTSQSIEINGTFIVDKDFNMLNCRIKMGANAQIVVEEGKRILLSRTLISSCGDVIHNGIKMKNRARFLITNSLIRNANIGIEFVGAYSPTSGFTNNINNTTFYNCGRGISAESGDDVISIFLTPLRFFGNQFLPRIGTDGPNIANEHSIFLTGAWGTFGTIGAINKFGDQALGANAAPIAVNYSIATISNAQFFSDRRMIYTTFSTLSVGTVNGGAGCIFTNSGGNVPVIQTDGIWVTTTIRGNEFLGQLRGGAVHCFSTNGQSDFHIDNNTINTEDGLLNTEELNMIEVTRPNTSDPNGPVCSINDNRINMYGGLSLSKRQNGILVRSSGCASKLNIERNIIRFETRHLLGDGILVSGTAIGVDMGIRIVDNDVFFDYNGPAMESDIFGGKGIALEDIIPDLSNPNENEISLNTVESAMHNDFPIDLDEGFALNPYSNVLCAIHVKKVKNLEVLNNTVTNAFRGFHMWGNNSACDFRCNIMNFGTDGLSVEEITPQDGNMTDQLSKNNEWRAAAYHRRGASGWGRNISQGGIVLETMPFQFLVNPDIPFNKPTTSAPVFWFEDISVISSCSGNNPPEPPIIDVDIFSPKEDKIIEEAYTFNSAVEEWDAEREIVLQLMHSPNLYQSSNTLNNWLTNQVGSSHYAFASAEKQLADAQFFTPTFSHQIDSLQKAAINVMGNIQVKEHLLIGGTSDSVQVGIELQLRADTVAKIQSDLLTLYTNAESNRVGILNNVITSIQNLPISTDYEKALQGILMYQAKVSRGDTISNKDMGALITLVDGCIYQFGTSIMGLGNILPDSIISKIKLKHPEYVNYECRRDANIKERSEDETGHHHTDIHISPNPTASVLNITGRDIPENNICQIIDNLGRIVKTFAVSHSGQAIPVADLPAGIFVLTIRTSERIVFNQKLIIQH
jgi:Secretion system C-terminal sorting domain